MATVLLPHLRPSPQLRHASDSLPRTCRLCGCNTSITRHHLIPRYDAGRASWRSDPRNIILVCRPCHDLIDAHSPWVCLAARASLRLKLHASEIAFIVNHRGGGWLDAQYPSP